MNRLRDDVGDDPVAERGIKLLRAYAATPADAEMKRRVWGSIQQTRLRGVAPQPFRRLRLAAAAAIVLGLAGTAGAMITQRWILPVRSDRLQPANAHPEASPRSRSQKRGAHTAANSATATNDVSEVSQQASGDIPVLGMARAAVSESLPAHRVAPASRSAAAGSRTRSPSRAPLTERRVARVAVEHHRADGLTPAETPPEARAAARERTQVLDALVALRRDRDGVRAGMLLDEYLSGFPRGVLREEALVLAIEAAAARGDGAAARRLASSYQAAYPGGRFSAFAGRHAGAGQP